MSDLVKLGDLPPGAEKVRIGCSGERVHHRKPYDEDSLELQCSY